MLKFVMILLLLLSSISVGNSAVIQGKIYSWNTFDPAENCIVIINSTPIQKIVAVNSTYSFSIPPGTYRLDAVCYDSLKLHASEVVEIRHNGTFQIDMLAQPRIEELNVTIPEINFTIDERTPPEKPETQSSGFNHVYFIAVLLLAAVSLGMYLALRKREQKDTTHEILPEDLNEILEIIKKEGGRVTQKELKRKTGYSDAKISLMIADLEKRGMVEKVKKGRGNIIFLKE